MHMTYCSSWHRVCSIVEYFARSVISVVYRKFLIDNIFGKKGLLVARFVLAFNLASSALCEFKF